MSEPWPASAIWGADDLTIAGVATSPLVERFGTPLVVYDENEIRARMRETRSVFPRVTYGRR